MRPVDADELRAEYQAILDRGDMFCEYDIIGMLDNAPTIEMKPFALFSFNKDELNRIVEERVIEPIKNGDLVVQTAGEWIPVSEGLPTRNGVYNVTRKLKEGETIYFISDASYFDGQNTWHRDTGVNHGRPYLNDVIAWMPRPEPYKEAEE